MRSQVIRSAMAIGAVGVIGVLWSPIGTGAGQSPQSPLQGPTAYKAPRTADRQPDLNGFWQAMNTANWDLEEHGTAPSPFPELLGAYLAQPAGFSVVEGGTIPYKPEALAKRTKLRETRLTVDPRLQATGATEELGDPEAKCFQGGVPRSAYLPFPFQIVQTRTKVLMAYDFAGGLRIIHLGEDLDKVRAAALLDIDTWNGQSVGRWDGETLVVDARWFSGPTVWLDRAGNFISASAVVVERYTPISPYHLRYEATITDSETFTRPWTISMPLYRRIEPNMELLRFECIPFAEPLMYGPFKKPGS